MTCPVWPQPAPIEVLGHRPELDDEIAGQVLRLGLAALFLPSRSRASSSSPMMIRASKPPMKCLTPWPVSFCAYVQPSVFFPESGIDSLLSECSSIFRILYDQLHIIRYAHCQPAF